MSLQPSTVVSPKSNAISERKEDLNSNEDSRLSFEQSEKIENEFLRVEEVDDDS